MLTNDNDTNEFNHSNTYNRTINGLIDNLMNAWTKKNIQMYYQNCFLQYLDHLPNQIVQKQISNQIRLTHQNKSFYYSIQKGMEMRTQVLDKLKAHINRTQRKQKRTQKDIQNICILLDELRAANLITAESLIQMNLYFFNNIKSDKNILNGHNSIFEALNSDCQFLKTSFMRKFIIFSNSYDPFFLHHYQCLKQTNDIKLRQFECIEQLFNIPISLAYKLVKTQEQILQFFSGGIKKDVMKIKHHPKTKRFGYTILSENSDDDMIKYHSNNLGIQNVKLVNKIYLNPKRISKEYKEKQSPLDNYSKYLIHSQERSLQLSSRSPVGSGSSSEMHHSKDKRQSPTRHELNKCSQKYHLPSINSPSNSLYQNSTKLKFPRSLKREAQNSKHSNTQSIENIENYKAKFLNRERRYTQQQVPINIRQSKNINLDESLQIIEQRRKKFKSFLPSKNSHEKKPDLKDKINEEKKVSTKQQFTQVENRLDEKPKQKVEIVNKKDVSKPQVKSKKQVKNQKTQLLKEKIVNYKNYKLKAGNFQIKDIFIFLRQLKIKQDYRKVFEIRNWESSIKNNQYYIHKYYIDQVLCAISLCCALPEGDILIKYWGPLENCDTEMSNFLFKKFLDHIEKNTIGKSIFYNALQIPEIFSNNFSKQKQRIYSRERILPIQVDDYNYYPFLSLNFSNIAVSKSFQDQNNLLIKQNIAEFEQRKFMCFNYLLIINKLMTPGSFASISSYSTDLPSIQQVKIKMLENQLNQFPYNDKCLVARLNLLTMKIRNPIFSAFFIAHQGYIKFIGEEIYSDQTCLLAYVQLLKFNAKMYFGSGFKQLSAMTDIIKKRSNKTSKLQFSVRMFNKKLRGKMNSINLKNQNCYGDIEIRFVWKDFLKGKIQHPMKECETFGDVPFFCVIQIERQIIFGFEVSEQNYV